ncbi:MAG: hypothetical protein IJ297_01130 [Clostridia bacterium]|nr:hypothetical protein [Clostridia bacterium]
MIIIIGMLFLLIIPFFIYWVGKETPLKKHVVIILETIAIGILIFSSVLVALDIPYIIEGGQLYEGEPLYMYVAKGTASLENDNVSYWMESSTFLDVNPEADIYVLPHTHLVYRIANNSIYDILLDRPAYHIKAFGTLSLTLLLFEIVFLVMTIKAWHKWS